MAIASCSSGISLNPNTANEFVCANIIDGNTGDVAPRY